VSALHLFGGFGVEIEYMLVDAGTLAVLPRSDEVLKSVAGRYESEVERGELCWSNELALHVIELKTNGPAPRLEGLAALFQRDVEDIEARLRPLGGRLMPTAMHPWMDPHRETRLWPHEYSAVYEAFHRIFSCRGHGWSNLQSVHLNLPFAGDEEFGRLHAAIRLVIPLLPALAASSPVEEGRTTGTLDNRLKHYRLNCARVPSVTGRVVPEAVFTRADYERVIFGRMFREIAPHDPEGILRHEWLNARGAIARFDRDAIEIRVIDTQESPRMDLAVCAAAVEALRGLVEERWSTYGAQREWPEERLAEILLATQERADEAEIADAEYLRVLGLDARRATAAEAWRHLLSGLAPAWRDDAAVLLDEGPLARRMLRALGPAPDFPRQREVYLRLCDCLATGGVFHA